MPQTYRCIVIGVLVLLHACTHSVIIHAVTLGHWCPFTVQHPLVTVAMVLKPATALVSKSKHQAHCRQRDQHCCLRRGNEERLFVAAVIHRTHSGLWETCFLLNPSCLRPSTHLDGS
jgi:hypothetical protein